MCRLYDGAWSSKYYIEGTENPRCWHSCDDAILLWIPSSGVGLVVGADWIPWESSDKPPTSGRLEGELFDERLWGGVNNPTVMPKAIAVLVISGQGV